MLLTLLVLPSLCVGLAASSTTVSHLDGDVSISFSLSFPSLSSLSSKNDAKDIPLLRPGGRLRELWDDPRPISSLVTDSVSSDEVPYCIQSTRLHVPTIHGRFVVLLYPRGRFGGRSLGTAAAYLRYEPEELGDEADVLWTLRLVDARQPAAKKTLPITTSGGLPRSQDTWSAGMTFTHAEEAVDSVGRTRDWGSSVWREEDVVPTLVAGGLRAEGVVRACGSRRGQRSLSAWPVGSRGAAGAVMRAIERGGENQGGRIFWVGEVIVPTRDRDGASMSSWQKFLLPGVDYRIMTMSDSEGNSIFSSLELSPENRPNARLALRPCGWRTQRSMWDAVGISEDSWPMEEKASVLMSAGSRSRFDLSAFSVRALSQIRREGKALFIAVLLAISPIPAVLIGRNYAQLYFIPSASMDPTLQVGDVMLVEKMPGAFDRTCRGDVIFFRPPKELNDIITRAGGTVDRNALFVKRVVGMPGDTGIVLREGTGDITVEGNPAVGPLRDLCDDEPLGLIDAYLQNGQGKNVRQLGNDEAYVLGDCKAVSVDSRVFGTLPLENIVGRPIGRVWPVNRIKFGSRF